MAGALIALPERVWHDPRLGQAILSGLGLLLVAMAVLQAWPGRGFWQGISHGQPGTLAGMTHDMAQTPQPGFLSGWVSSFTSFDEAHGFAVNLFAVAALALIGAAFLTGRRRLARPALIAFTVLCLVDWVLIEDIGIFGGLGTDPNSMIPFILLAVSGYLALTPETAPAEAASPTVTAAEPVPAATPASPAVPALAPASAWRDRFRPAALRRGLATASFPTGVSIGALGLIILGAAPMAAAQASRNADPILAESIAGSSVPLDFPAKSFALTDQRECSSQDLSPAPDNREHRRVLMRRPTGPHRGGDLRRPDRAVGPCPRRDGRVNTAGKQAGSGQRDGTAAAAASRNRPGVRHARSTD